MWLFKKKQPAPTKEEEQVKRDLESLENRDENAAAAEGQAEGDYVPDDESAPASPVTDSQQDSVMTEQEKALAAEMMAKLAEMHNGEVPKPLSPLDITFEWTLVRFLRARKYDVAAAIDQYLKMLEWRKENRVDGILTQPDPHEHVYQCVCPHRHHGFDRDGRPVYLERTGLIRVGDMLKHMTEPDIVRRHIRAMEYARERMISQSQKLGRYIGKQVVIQDLAGMRYTIETAGMRAFRQTTHIDQQFYPECLHRGFLINAPLSFRGVWTVVKPWLDVKTRAKIEILGANAYKERVALCVAPDQLPELLGGTCKCSDVHSNGDPCLPNVRALAKAAPEEIPVAWPAVHYDDCDIVYDSTKCPPPAAENETNKNEAA